MDKEELNSLLDTIYELEGLVHLALSREDNERHLIMLIKRKAAELAGLVTSASPQPTMEATQPVATPADDPLPPEEELQAIETMEELTSSAWAANSSDNHRELSEAPQTGDIPNVEPTQGMEPTPGKKERGKLVFSLNDRYRFKRELFGNSNQEFEKAMGEVAAMDSFEEAENHFIDELGWDPDNADVKEFLGVVQNYFK